MLRPRIIVCLDVKDGRVVKGTRFRGLRDVGDPVDLASRYEAEGADEIVFLDISASHEGRGTLLETVRRTAEVLFIPLTVGGGVRTVEDMHALLRAGADKVSVNSGAVRDPSLLTRGAARFGSQCVVASIDAARQESGPAGPGWYHHTHGGRKATELEAVEWARTCVERGAGEILLTSIDRDGVRTGYDLELTRAVAEAVSVPVIASGGAGTGSHLREGFEKGKAAAVLLAGILHDGITTVGALKEELQATGIPVRPAPGISTMRTMRELDDLEGIRFDPRGLVPVVVQEGGPGLGGRPAGSPPPEREAVPGGAEGACPSDAEGAPPPGAVLMVAWANREALERTLETGLMHYWSRSRETLWKKGETSGNLQRVISLHADCDADTILAQVHSHGPACHTGRATCFGVTPSGGADRVLSELGEVLEERARTRPEGSYTVRLLDDENLRIKKLGEEMAELVTALVRGDGRAPEEAADLLYHLLVALKGAGHRWEEVVEALAARRG